MTLPIKNIFRPALTTGFILLLLLVAMQFNKEMTWSPFDFILAGILLFGTGLAYESVAWKAGSTAYRVAMGVALAAALLLVWVNLAVGVIGSEDNPANLLFGGVLAVGIIGAIAARLRPHGMARTMLATALAQGLVPVIALVIWKPEMSVGVVGVFGANAVFVLLWLASAWLFRRVSATGAALANLA